MPWRCMFGHDWAGCRCARSGCGARRNLGHTWSGVVCVVCGMQADLLDPRHLQELQAQGYTVVTRTESRELLERLPCEEPLHCKGDCPACRQGLIPVLHHRLIVEVFSDGHPIACHIREG
ncbi:MAG: hypothetical protein NZM31_05405 [Gemmatales bacterium]|nr:hypothetical protein [Gemmatales bacterium]MDW8386435.1 hypothetical protein [Gemmatales bacterium]